MKNVCKKTTMSAILVAVLFILPLCMFPNVAKGAESDYVISGQNYYIKNVRSGKYLTLYNGNTTDGTNIVQYEYEGTTRQQWKIQYNSGTGPYSGMYKIFSVKAPSMCLGMESSQSTNGINLELQTSASVTKQHFKITDNTCFAHTIETNGSNFTKVLTVQSASCANNANVYQYTYNQTGNDEWLIEPVTGYYSAYGVQYSIYNKLKYTQAYPHINDTTYQMHMSENMNFVSQALCAAGHHYRKTSPYTYKQWYVEKNSHPSGSIPSSSVGTYWDYGEMWFSGTKFCDYWRHIKTNNSYTLSDIINNTNTGSSVTYGVGDIVQIYYYNMYEDSYEVYFSGYITTASSIKGNCEMTFHSTNNGYKRTVSYMCNTFSSPYKVVFLDFT